MVTAERQWMTVAEVAAESGYHPETVYRALARRELVGFKQGRGRNARWRVPRDEFLRWMRGPH